MRSEEPAATLRVFVGLDGAVDPHGAGALHYGVDPRQLPVTPVAGSENIPRISELKPVPGTSLGVVPRYKIEEVISASDIAFVLNVRDNVLDRVIALKLCRWQALPDAALPKEAGEFANEAFMTTRLEHPSVIPIHEAGRDQFGRPFFAMKLVSGLTWKDAMFPEHVVDPARRATARTRSEHMGLPDHFEVLLKVCDAVAFAHSKGILHRDLKPQNIMLGNFGEVYLMDWGLAIFFDERCEYRRIPGLRPQTAGTPCYMAPEMARGEMTALCPASDVYTLGGILYELLTGAPPHEGHATSEVLRSAASGKVPSLEEVCGPGVIPASLSRIVMKALAPKIDDRYPTVVAFQRDVHDYMIHSDSIAASSRALVRLADIQAHPESEDVAALYAKISECIGAFEQAIQIWAGNQEALFGYLDALAIQVRIAARHRDMALARTQLQRLEECAARDKIAAVAARARALSAELTGILQP